MKQKIKNKNIELKIEKPGKEEHIETNKKVERYNDRYYSRQQVLSTKTIYWPVEEEKHGLVISTWKTVVYL